ncbi:MAG: hypothetical protein KAH91_06010 [Thermoplasmatales archaeon]|nr:hypothetical protein [Thermoplasmatales archaeon]
MRKINWQVYEKTEEEELRLFLEISKRIVWSQKEPRAWNKKAGPGRPPYDWKGVVTLLLLKLFYRLKFREIASFAKGFPGLKELLELEKAPSRSTLQRDMHKIDVAWLRKLNDAAVAEFKKSGNT